MLWYKCNLQFIQLEYAHITTVVRLTVQLNVYFMIFGIAHVSPVS